MTHEGRDAEALRGGTSDLSWILPVYNALPFLRATLEACEAYAKRLRRPVELIVVDDGSTDGTDAVLAAWAEEGDGAVRRRRITLPANRGKGHAVRCGMLAAEGAFRVFLDADPSYPVENVGRILAALERGADVAIGNRLHPASRLEVSPGRHLAHAKRWLVGRLWNLAVRALASLPFADTQAGIKGFTARSAVVVFSRAEVDRFAFDVEVLLLARDFRLSVRDVPVRLLNDTTWTTLAMARDGRRMLADLLRLSWRRLDQAGAAGRASGRSAIRTSAGSTSA